MVSDIKSFLNPRFARDGRISHRGEPNVDCFFPQIEYVVAQPAKHTLCTTGMRNHGKQDTTFANYHSTNSDNRTVSTRLGSDLKQLLFSFAEPFLVDLTRRLLAPITPAEKGKEQART